MRSLEEIFGSEGEVIEKLRQFALLSNREAARSTTELYFLYKEDTTSQFDKNVAEEAIMYQLNNWTELSSTDSYRLMPLKF